MNCSRNRVTISLLKKMQTPLLYSSHNFKFRISKNLCQNVDFKWSVELLHCRSEKYIGSRNNRHLAFTREHTVLGYLLKRIYQIIDFPVGWPRNHVTSSDLVRSFAWSRPRLIPPLEGTEVGQQGVCLWGDWSTNHQDERDVQTVQKGRAGQHRIRRVDWRKIPHLWTRFVGQEERFDRGCVSSGFSGKSAHAVRNWPVSKRRDPDQRHHGGRVARIAKSHQLFVIVFRLWSDKNRYIKVIYINRYKMVKSVDGSYGSRLPDGTYSGMMGMLARDEIDVAVGDFNSNYERLLVGDFLKGFTEVWYIVLPPRQIKSTVRLCQRKKSETSDTNIWPK